MRLRDIMTTHTVVISPPSNMALRGSARGAAGVPSKAGEAYAEQEERTVTARTRSRDRRSDR